jgi:predicted nuclease of predicted toxin-antitoxin system
MHIKVDEDLPRAIAEVLRQRGYSCSTVVEQKMGGWADADLWEVVQDHEQFLITAGKGFGDIRRHAPAPRFTNQTADVAEAGPFVLMS